MIEEKPGLVQALIKGPKAKECFRNEAGAMRWQRVPPTEKKGRRQTSTITVAVLDIPEKSNLVIKESDLQVYFRRGSGPGGQHKNKVESCVDMVHIPTGIKVTVDGRSQGKNKELALNILKARIDELNKNKAHTDQNDTRRKQIGPGNRAEKRRTIKVYDNFVEDHITGIYFSYDDYAKGKFPWLD